MKDKRPIEVQVAELTEEQKQKIPKIFWMHLIITIVIIGAHLISGLFCVINVEAAKAELRSIEARRATASLWESLSLTKEWLAASDRYDVAMQTLTTVGIGTAVAGIIAVLGVQLYITKKYPFYSEKKHFYLRKIARQG